MTTKPGKKRAIKTAPAAPRTRKRVSTTFEKWLVDNGYTRGKSGWLSPDKKKFFPL